MSGSGEQSLHAGPFHIPRLHQASRGIRRTRSREALRLLAVLPHESQPGDSTSSSCHYSLDPRRCNRQGGLHSRWRTSWQQEHLPAVQDHLDEPRLQEQSSIPLRARSRPRHRPTHSSQNSRFSLAVPLLASAKSTWPSPVVFVTALESYLASVSHNLPDSFVHRPENTS